MSLQKLLKISVFSLCSLLGGGLASDEENIDYGKKGIMNYESGKKEILREEDGLRARSIFDYKSGNYLGIRVA